jgi:hypothetical protein
VANRWMSAVLARAVGARPLYLQSLRAGAQA